MKKIILAGLIVAAGTASMFTPVEAAKVAVHTGYCRMNIYDPICMDREMMKMRTGMMGMTKAKAMANRTKYCRNNIADPICNKKMMNSTMGY